MRRNWSKPRIFRFLDLRIRLAEAYLAAERHSVLFWAGLVGILGGLSSVLFRKALALGALLLSGQSGGMVEIFSRLPEWKRLLIPMCGGIVAGLLINYGARLKSSRSATTDFMEAVALGDGTLSFGTSMAKTFSALASVISGGSIGREGPMVQLSALIASLVGRTRPWTVSRRRLILACGASAGIASAYNAPIAGALFVAEIVLGSIAMETFGPLILSSVLATQVVHLLAGSTPIYAIPPFRLNSGLELLNYLLLGVLAGLVAPWFLRALRASEKLFTQTRLPIALRMGLGGLIVGMIAVWYPQVCGNGYSVVTGILHGQWIWSGLAAIILLKLVATCSSFGSGAVGGVFTPTLFMGASFGYLFGYGIQALGFGALTDPAAFALTGMGMFLAATTQAPLMAIIIIFEMTQDYELILPLMLGCVIAYFVARSIDSRSIYSSSLERKRDLRVDRALSRLRVGHLMKPDPAQVHEETPFREIAKYFILHTFRYLYVVDENGIYLGSICLEDIKEHLGSPFLADLVIARDLLRPLPPAISFSASLEDALYHYTDHQGERLPVVADGSTPRLLGTITKTDLLLTLADRLHLGPQTPEEADVGTTG